MIALTGNITMLYCPKCRRTYEEGTQRFCDNDGGRLLPAPSSPKDDLNPGGVFSNLLAKTKAPELADKKATAAPRFIPLNKTEESGKKLTSFPSAGRIFQSEKFLRPKTAELPEAEDSILELEPLPKKAESEFLLELEPFQNTENPETPLVKTAAQEILPKVKVSEPLAADEIEPQISFKEVKTDDQKTLPRLVKPGEIASGTALVGDRRANPPGREALSRENPDVLIGQTVKGRYQILEELEPDDEDSIIYLAEDKIFSDKKVIVRIFMNDDFRADEQEEKVFAEERVSLSHLNHPNIAGVFDSGELPEGKEFIVSEFIEGKSLAEMLGEGGQFNSLRTARIIRQTSYALSEAHQNGILHRNLKPQNIVLTVSEAGIEQVKLINFGVSHGEITGANLAYKAPEEIEGGVSTFASDIFALGVIGYQMLTGQMPFPLETESALRKAQKSGLTLPPTVWRTDIQPLADKILEKALAFNPSERYPKARDFGDAFFNALTTVAPWKKDAETEPESLKETPKQREFIVVPAINQNRVSNDISPGDAPVDADIHISPSLEINAGEISDVKTPNESSWEKRSPEPPKKGSPILPWLAIAGVLLLLLGFFVYSRLAVNNANPTEGVQNKPNLNETPVVPTEKTLNNSLPAGETDIAPEPRLQKTPPNSARFQNSREGLNENLAKNFLGFEIFYPQDWIKKPTESNFLDISKRTSDNFPVEQLIVTRYESRGTMALDRPNFPKLVEKSNQDLKNPKILGESYTVISEGETVIQNGRWKVYEVKFQSSGKNEKGENITVWGRRLWLPVQRPGVQNGFVITLLATSLSDSVKSVDDVGVQGELANVLETFEPEQF